jgi:hypothetical protein
MRLIYRPLEDRIGNCFQCAAESVLEHPSYSDFDLCHGICTGLGKIQGQLFVHAWCESDQIVYDAVRQFVMPKEEFYSIGRIDSASVMRYSAQDIIEQIEKHETWGPWAPHFLTPDLTIL